MMFTKINFFQFFHFYLLYFLVFRLQYEEMDKNKQTKFRSTIDKALEGTYQISTCLLRYLADKSYFLIFHCAAK